VYIHTCVYIYTQIYTNIYVYIHLCTYICRRIYVGKEREGEGQRYVYIYTYVGTYICVYICVCVCVRTHVHAYVYVGLSSLASFIYVFIYICTRLLHGCVDMLGHGYLRICPLLAALPSGCMPPTRSTPSSSCSSMPAGAHRRTQMSRISEDISGLQNIYGHETF